MKVSYTSGAARDLSNVLDYISTRSHLGAENVKRAIYRTIALIGEHPLSGRKIADTEIRRLRPADFRISSTGR